MFHAKRHILGKRSSDKGSSVMSRSIFFTSVVKYKHSWGKNWNHKTEPWAVRGSEVIHDKHQTEASQGGEVWKEKVNFFFTLFRVKAHFCLSLLILFIIYFNCVSLSALPVKSLDTTYLMGSLSFCTTMYIVHCHSSHQIYSWTYMEYAKKKEFYIFNDLQ